MGILRTKVRFQNSPPNIKIWGLFTYTHSMQKQKWTSYILDVLKLVKCQERLVKCLRVFNSEIVFIQTVSLTLFASLFIHWANPAGGVRLGRHWC